MYLLEMGIHTNDMFPQTISKNSDSENVMT
jgi:hypothetical protein